MTKYLSIIGFVFFFLGLPIALSGHVDGGVTGAALFQCWGSAAACFVGVVIFWLIDRPAKPKKKMPPSQSWTTQDEIDYQKGINVRPSPGNRPPWRNPQPLK